MGGDREGVRRQGGLTCNILILIGVGHLVLAAFVLVAGVINRGGSRVDGTRPSSGCGCSPPSPMAWSASCRPASRSLNEIGAFIPIFGVPAAVAWYLSRRHAAQLKV